ncbi:MAG: haloacid dehalogenase [Ardenticatenaceae bacterium]|nr:MAG: haloacid dehalogenase [Ardenticatenaceae bacterium]
MLKAILFDLDDTLLGNDMDDFLPGYFKLLGGYAAHYFSPEQFLEELRICTEAMVQNVDPTVANRDVFWSLFAERTGKDPNEMEAFFETFYLEQFGQLQGLTQKRPFASQLVQYCFDHQLDVVVATNPLFPMVAIEARLEWAGLPVNQYDFSLVTSYENMHAAKPHPAYYAEILEKIDCPPEQALMVGNDWENDIVPANALGIESFWLSLNGAAPPDEQPVPYGRTLQDVHTFLAARLEREVAK